MADPCIRASAPASRTQASTSAEDPASRALAAIGVPAIPRSSMILASTGSAVTLSAAPTKSALRNWAPGASKGMIVPRVSITSPIPARQGTTPPETATRTDWGSARARLGSRNSMPRTNR